MQIKCFQANPSWFLRVATCLMLSGGCTNAPENDKNQEAETSDRNDDGDPGGEQPNDTGNGEGDNEEPTNKDGPGVSNLFEYKSGSRLSPHFLNASDGASQFYGWYDEKLEIPCSFQKQSSQTSASGSDAKHYCLPPMVKRAMGNYYADEECEQSVDVAIVDLCSDPENIKYAQIDALSCGEGHLKIREVTQIKKLNSEHKLWYRPNLFTPCSDVRMTPTQYAVMELGDEVSLDRFVSASASK